MSNLKIFSVVAGLLLVLAVVPFFVKGQTAAELEAQIQQLLAQLQALQNQLNQVQGGGQGGNVPAVCSGVTFSRNLSVGSRGADVKCLQAILNQSPDTQVATSGAGSPGNETTYFGPKTKTAVAKFQQKYASEILAPLGLTKGTGFVGASTRAKLNSILTSGQIGEEEEEEEQTSPPPTPPATGDFKVELASNNPAGTVIPSGSAYNTVLKAKISAGSQARTITSVTIERIGYSVDSNISGVLVTVDEQGDKRYGNVVTFADNKATISFTNDPINIPAGQSVTLSVKYHIASGATSGTVGAKLTAVSGDPQGLPLTGNFFTLTSGSSVLGTLTVDVVSLTSTTVNVDIGTKDYILTKFRFVAGANEDIKISKLVLFQNGTAADEDLKNWKLVDPAGTVLATADKAVGKVITFNLANPYVIAKGTQKDLSVLVEVVSGSSRTAQVIIQNDYDVVAMGASSGAGILPTAAGVVDTNGFPMGDIASGSSGYNHLTVAPGTLTVNKSTSSPSGTFGIGASNVVLATWELEAKGEDIQIQRADIEITGTTAASDFSGTIRLETEAGQTLYSVAPGSAAGIFDNDATPGGDQVTLASFYTIPAGQVLKLKLVVNASTSVTDGETAIGRIGAVYYKRMTSNTYDTASATAWVAGNTLTASSASFTVVKNASYGDTTVIAGQSGVKLGSYLLQVGASEGVNVSSINVDLTRGDHTTALNSNELAALSNLKLVRADTGAQLGSVVANPAATNTFTVAGQLNIPANTTVQVDVYANISTSNYAADYGTDLDANDVSGTGATSGTTISGPSATVTGQTIAVVASGTLTVSIETSGAASSQFYTAGLTGVEMARIKLYATVENMKVQKLVLRTVNGSGNIANVKLLGTGLSSDPVVPLTGGLATFTFSSGNEIVVPAYGSKVLTAVVDTTGVGTLVAGQLGVLGFGTMDAIGAGSGKVTQENFGGTAGTNYYVAGTDNTNSFSVGDIIYFTATADAGTIRDPGFYMVTAPASNVNLASGSLTLNAEAVGTSWTADDIVVKLSKVGSDDTIDSMAFALNVGDVIYVHHASAPAKDGFYIVKTAVASGGDATAVSNIVDGLTLASGDIITKLTNTNALVGNTMRFEEVEPVITLASSSPAGSTSPGSDQVVAVFDVKASGYRDLTWNSLTLEKAGSNSPERYVTKFSLWQGNTKLAEVANTNQITATTTSSGALSSDGGYVLCSDAADSADEILLTGGFDIDKIAVGDKIRIWKDASNYLEGTITSLGSVSGSCNGGTPANNLTLSNVSLTGTIAASSSVIFQNFNVHFDANQSAIGDTPLAEQTITAGQTMTLTVKADTSAVKTGASSGTVTFGVSIPGTAGPLQVGSTQVEGFRWSYTPLVGSAGYKTEADNYPILGGTLIY